MKNSNNVMPFKPRRRVAAHGINSPSSDTGAAFDRLTAALVMDKHARGELDPGIVAALLAGVGLEVPR